MIFIGKTKPYLTYHTRNIKDSLVTCKQLNIDAIERYPQQR